MDLYCQKDNNCDNNASFAIIWNLKWKKCIQILAHVERMLTHLERVLTHIDRGWTSIDGISFKVLFVPIPMVRIRLKSILVNENRAQEREMIIII